MEEKVEGGSLLRIRGVSLPRHIGNSISVYLFLEFKSLPSKSEEFSSQRMKQSRALRIIFTKKRDRLCMKFSLGPNTKCTEVHQSSVSTPPLSNVPYFSKIFSRPGQNQQNGKYYCLPPLPFKISLKDTSFHTSLNSSELYLSL